MAQASIILKKMRFQMLMHSFECGRVVFLCDCYFRLWSRRLMICTTMTLLLERRAFLGDIDIFTTDDWFQD